MTLALGAGAFARASANLKSLLASIKSIIV